MRGLSERSEREPRTSLSSGPPEGVRVNQLLIDVCVVFNPVGVVESALFRVDTGPGYCPLHLAALWRVGFLCRVVRSRFLLPS